VWCNAILFLCHVFFSFFFLQSIQRKKKKNNMSVLITNRGVSNEWSWKEIKEVLEYGSVDEKKEALKRTIVSLSKGETCAGDVLMKIIRFVLPIRDNELKKLLLLYWEVVPKTSSDGKLLSEFILVCNSLRNDLNHPNEYIRGSTLRYLCKLREPELLEPLLPSIRANLEHRHSYVRRNAVLTVDAIYARFAYLCPDAPDLVFQFLVAEGDPSCQRNAFIMLCNNAQEKAVEYLAGVLDQVASFGDILQLMVVELVRKVCQKNPDERPRFLRCLWGLLSSPSAAVQFEAAATLVSLTTAPTAVRAAASAFIALLSAHSDNNVKMIVLDRLTAIKQRHPKVMQELVMDLLRALASPDLDIRRKTLAVALDLVSPRNIDQVIGVLKKEVSRAAADADLHRSRAGACGLQRASGAAGFGALAGAGASGLGDQQRRRSGGESGPSDGDTYSQILIAAIHQCAVRFSSVAGSVVHVLMDFLGDDNVASALNVAKFVRQVAETYPDMRAGVVRKLLQSLDVIRSPTVLRAVLWVVAEYCDGSQDIGVAITALERTVGPLPLVASDDDGDGDKQGSGGDADTDGKKGKENKAAANKPKRAGPVVLADGTYASQSALDSSSASSVTSPSSLMTMGADEHPIRRLVVDDGDYFLASALCETLAKLLLKARQRDDIAPRALNRVTADVLLIMTSLLRHASAIGLLTADNDCYDRMCACVRAVAMPSPLQERLFLARCRDAFKLLLAEEQRVERTRQAERRVAASAAERASAVQADDLIKLRQLQPRKHGLGDLGDLSDARDLSRATGLVADSAALAAATSSSSTSTSSPASVDADSADGELRLNRIYQLTGYSDPIYAEAVVNVRQYDIVLDVTVINQTQDTLQNVCLELATLGDLRLVERPQHCTIGPRSSVVIAASVKVSSTETGVIFGDIVYDVAGASSADKNCVILNDIHIDIMDYILPADCTELAFQRMWAAFEWENKVSVNTYVADDVNLLLDEIVRCANMRCLTPASALAGRCGFLAANLYARSIFGEDALANVGVEHHPTTNKVTGYIRIRSKTQGIALSLGACIAAKQRQLQELYQKQLLEISSTSSDHQ
jgi:coatomer subunit beta